MVQNSKNTVVFVKDIKKCSCFAEGGRALSQREAALGGFAPVPVLLPGGRPRAGRAQGPGPVTQEPSAEKKTRRSDLRFETLKGNGSTGGTAAKPVTYKRGLGAAARPAGCSPRGLCV